MSSINMVNGYYKEVEKAKKEHWPVFIPVGTMEYHSTHCPYGCDSLVSEGICKKIGEKIDALILPTIYYGVASYAVGGPEKNTLNVDCDTFENYVYAILKSLFDSGFDRNIYLIIAHQTEDYMPMTLSCMKASKKLIMSYYEDKFGYGWWGDNKNRDFYANIAEKDSPWNRIRVIRFPSDAVRAATGADHAGKYESGYLEYLYPGIIKLDRLKDSNDWFSEDAKDMDLKIGKKTIDLTVEEILKIVK